MVGFFQKLFKLYHIAISPMLGNRCRYAPSCSEYAHQALEIHGAGKGLWLTTKRLCRCHPWGGHGFDPVPGSEYDLNRDKESTTE
jgi:putative membrane protein insertion efficiency factor